MTKSNKVDFHLWLSPDTVKLMKKHKAELGLKTHSMFIEKAIRFYSGYLSSNEKGMYLPETVNDLFKSYFGDFEDKMCNMIFKIAVELAMFLHVYCALNNVTEENINEVHDSVMKEVRSTYGGFSFKNILEFQNSQK